MTTDVSGRHDYDLLDPDYISDPASTWARFRTACPVARSDDHGGSWLPTRYDDIVAVARDVETFCSSQGISVIEVADRTETLTQGSPPIDADPPLHTWTRRLMLPAMSPQSVASYEPGTRALCRSLIESFVESGHADAAADYAQQLPVRVIGALLGIPEEHSDRFVGWVRSIVEFGHDAERRGGAMVELAEFLQGEIADRRRNPGGDLISHLVLSEHDGEPIDEALILGEAAILLVAGVDTTWSAIGSSLFHLATHPDDRRRMVEDADVWPLAIEEFLRFYSPVTMGRTATTDTEIHGCPISAGDRVLLSFPAANRDESHFDDADRFVIDRAENRHLAFGVGIHRCAGLEPRPHGACASRSRSGWPAIPEFELDGDVTWAGGQIRGPRSVPVTFPRATPGQRGDTIMSNDLMSDTRSTPIDSPAAWYGRDLQDRDDWVEMLTPVEVDELLAAVADVAERGVSLLDMRRDDFVLPTLGTRLHALADELDRGRGFWLLRGLPSDEMGQHDAAVAYWGIGLHLGVPVSQNSRGHLLGHVTDEGVDIREPGSRGYQTRVRLPYHTDSSDTVGLLCLQPSKSGGLSSLVSSTTVFNETLRRRPDLAHLWFQDWYFDRRNEERPGESPFFATPLACWHGGLLSIRYVRAFMDSAQRHADVPRRTDDETAFLDLIDEITTEDGIAVHMDFRPGDIQFLSNYTTLHSRTDYDDWPEPERKRHLLRLWISLDDGRPLPKSFGRGVTAGMAGRGGIPAVPELADPLAGTDI